MKKTQQGFTLIELMIVVAIIGILAAVAIPAYKDYIARSQATEAAVLLAGLKAPLAEYYNDQGSLPSVGDLNAVTSGKYVASITASGTNYRATFAASGVSPQLTNATMSLNYDTANGTFSFNCAGISNTNVRPKNCN